MSELSRPGLERRMGIKKPTREFDPELAMIRSIHSPWGELCCDSIILTQMGTKGGSSSRTKKHFETYSDLLPVGGTFLVFETDSSFWWGKQ